MTNTESVNMFKKLLDTAAPLKKSAPLSPPGAGICQNLAADGSNPGFCEYPHCAITQLCIICSVLPQPPLGCLGGCRVSEHGPVWDRTGSEQVGVLPKGRVVEVVTAEFCCGKLDQPHLLPPLQSSHGGLGKSPKREYRGGCSMFVPYFRKAWLGLRGIWAFTPAVVVAKWSALKICLTWENQMLRKNDPLASQIEQVDLVGLWF